MKICQSRLWLVFPLLKQSVTNSGLVELDVKIKDPLIAHLVEFASHVLRLVESRCSNKGLVPACALLPHVVPSFSTTFGIFLSSLDMCSKNAIAIWEKYSGSTHVFAGPKMFAKTQKDYPELSQTCLLLDRQIQAEPWNLGTKPPLYLTVTYNASSSTRQLVKHIQVFWYSFLADWNMDNVLVISA